MEKSIFIKKINRYFHDIEANYFDFRHSVRIREESHLYRGFFQHFFRENQPDNVRILEVGTGTGLVPRVLTSFHYSPQYLCIDLSFSMLNAVRNCPDLCNKGFLRYSVCDSEQLSFKSERFDLVICNAALHHFPNAESFFEEAHRVLTPGGILIIGHEPNKRFWTNRAVSFAYRTLHKINKLFSRDAQISKTEKGDYSKVCNGVNEILLNKGLITEPLPHETILGHVDIHSPNSGSKIDYSKGFAIQEIKERFSKGYSIEQIRYHYSQGSPNGAGILWRLFRLYNRIVFPASAPSFSLILRKG
ncbi:MAG: class I SAM-dependent methyltransferase [Desulfobacterales bacterium]|nr:class I SAM-dependent methyltransferase [Desulfobacterales bacterium]